MYRRGRGAVIDGKTFGNLLVIVRSGCTVMLIGDLRSDIAGRLGWSGGGKSTTRSFRERIFNRDFGIFTRYPPQLSRRDEEKTVRLRIDDCRRLSKVKILLQSCRDGRAAVRDFFQMRG